MGNGIEHQFVCHLNPFPSECLSALGLPLQESFGWLKAFHNVAAVSCHTQNTSDDFDYLTVLLVLFLPHSVAGAGNPAT